VLTVIDGLAALEAGRSESHAQDAIVVPSGGHTYALLVEEVEDVIEASAPPVPAKAPLGAGWDRVSLGMVEVEGDLFLLIDPHLLIAGPAARAA
jgi:purine-binding chemotaxis protein CheW